MIPNTLLCLRYISVLQIHNYFSELEKFLALKRFGRKIRDHIVGGTIFNMKVTLFDSVGDKKIPDIQMFSSLGTGSSSVVLKENF